MSLGLVTVGFAAAAYRFCPPFRAVALVAVGRGPDCPLSDVIRAHAVNDMHRQAAEQIAAASRKVADDPMGLELWETPKGRYWVPKLQGELLTFLLAEQDRGIYGTGDKGVQQGDVVFDCGAHVGVFTRTALARGAKLVVAIEPSPKILECLRRNTAEDQAAGRVIVVPKGVWDREGVLPFHVDDINTGMGKVLTNGKGEIEVPLVTIDQLAKELKLERVNFIKMDIEGAEPKALDGARNTLGAHHPRLAICVYHEKDDPVNVPLAARRGWSGYRSICGPCEDQFSKIGLETMLFY
jgi:FkbM family methyltransferase